MADTATPFTHRVATHSDIPALTDIMNASIASLQQGFLSPRQVEASFELMGMDTQLIDDGTYYAIMDGDEIVGCGGWSRRATLYGANHTKGRDATLLDPHTDAARIRAMYTHPGHARRGIGRLIMNLCEKKAAEEGFTRYELMATLSGEPLYRACGYLPVVHEVVPTSMGVAVPLIKMEKHR
ncbi:GNAT family N-acetyltransferase [Kordiimonas aestuarii]|uniref:GNAT family N-acetyltransferase n=1 Tax=Kordiimonas aestuarii TaxID=1005925 RepID=UPI0021D1D395|nr:GNAT family N-acetyltransferase [Kordiimonas aestuarii]